MGSTFNNLVAGKAMPGYKEILNRGKVVTESMEQDVDDLSQSSENSLKQGLSL